MVATNLETLAAVDDPGRYLDYLPGRGREAPQWADRYLTERNWQISEKLIDYAEARGHTALELAFSWLLAQSPVSSVIAGATKPEQLAQNAVAGGWKLTAAELVEIDAISA